MGLNSSQHHHSTVTTFIFDKVSIPMLSGTDPVVIWGNTQKAFQQHHREHKTKVSGEADVLEASVPTAQGGYSSQNPMLTDQLPDLCWFNTVEHHCPFRSAAGLGYASHNSLLPTQSPPPFARHAEYMLAT